MELLSLMMVSNTEQFYQLRKKKKQKHNKDNNKKNTTASSLICFQISPQNILPFKIFCRENCFPYTPETLERS